MPYLDIADDGTVVSGTAIEDGGDPVVRFGDGMPLAVPVYVRNLVVRRDGKAVAFKGQDGTGYLVTRSGAIEPQGPVYGDEAVAFTPDGRLVTVTSQDHYLFNGLRLPLPSHRRGTSQGILDAYNDGAIRWMDDCFSTPKADRTYGPLEFVKWRTRGAWTFGLSQQGCAVWNAATRKAYVLPQANHTPWMLRGALVPGGLVIVSSLPAMVFPESMLTPYVAHVLPNVDNTPARDNTPVPPREEPPMDKMMLPANVYATLVAVVQQYPHTGDDDDRRAAMRKVVETLRARHGLKWVCKSEHPNGWESASKDALGYVPGVPVHGARMAMYIWDTINGSSRQPNPAGLSEELRPAYALAPDPIDWLQPLPRPVPVPPPSPVPTPTPQPPADLTPVLVAIGQINGRLDGVDARLDRLESALLVLAAKVDAVAAEEPPRYEGNARWIGKFTLEPKP